MIKDYANIKKQAAPEPKPSRWLPLSLLTITALALLTVLIVQIHSHSKHQQSLKKAQHTPPKETTVKVAKKPAINETEFEFYQLLSKKQNLPQQPANEPAAKTNSNDNSAQYQLQTASLSNRLDAQRFSRQLLSLGYKASIQPFLHADGSTRYRVVIGPIDNFASAKQLQSTLQAQHINSLLSKATA